MAGLSLWSLLSFVIITLASSIAIRGPQDGVNALTGERPVRQEFSVFKDSGPAFELYIQSFNHFKRQNQSSLLSYYQVSGTVLKSLLNCFTYWIVPRYPRTALQVMGWGWWSVWERLLHASVYLVSFMAPTIPRSFWGMLMSTSLVMVACWKWQQIIWKNAQHIARSYPFSQRSKYQEAARTLRIPYWDWAINPAMPDLTNTPSITINSPRGLCNVSNPLYDYTFHPQPSAADFPPRDIVSIVPVENFGSGARAHISPSSVSTGIILLTDIARSISPHRTIPWSCW